MTKLRLNLDDLAVDTFRTAAAANEAVDRAPSTRMADGHDSPQDRVRLAACASNPTCCPCTPMI